MAGSATRNARAISAGRQPGDLAERQPDARLGGERRVAAGEDEREPVVGDRAHVVLLGGQRFEPGEQLGLAREGLLAADPVDRAVAGRRDDPGAGIGGLAVALPPLECDRERVLHRVLGELDVAEDAGEDGDGTAPLLPVDPRERGQCSITGRSSTDAREATGIRAAIAIAASRSSAFDLHQAADLLLRLGVGAVGDDRLAVADADGLRGPRHVELGAEAERAGRAELAEERLPLRDLLGARGLRLLRAHLLPGLDVLGAVREQGDVLHDALTVPFAFGSM